MASKQSRDEPCEIVPQNLGNTESSRTKRKEREATAKETSKKALVKTMTPKATKSSKGTTKKAAKKTAKAPEGSEPSKPSSATETPRQAPERTPQSANLNRFFGGASADRIPSGLSPAGTGTGSVVRADYMFLQGAYEGMQEQNARLTQLLENLTKTHDRVLLEKESSEKETKRLREVCAVYVTLIWSRPVS